MKELKANDVSCDSCGSTMKYSPKMRMLKCDNCQSCKKIPLEQLLEKHNWSDRNLVLDSSWNAEVKNLKCPNCGASIILNKLEYSSTCPYCDSGIVSVDAVNTITPDGIIPFIFDDAEASKKYVEGLRKKWFLPNKFKKAPPVDTIKGIYIPVFSYDANTSTNYDGVLVREHTVRDSRGTHVERRYFSISGTHNAILKNIVVETSSKITQSQYEEISPYNMEKIAKFNQGFIMGYTVEMYANSVEACKKVANEIMSDIIKRQILSKYFYDDISSFSMQTNRTNEKFMYYLLPVYKCSYKYKKKQYTTFMNGQTGKVGGGTPLSPVKITFFTLFIILLVAAVVFLFVHFGMDHP